VVDSISIPFFFPQREIIGRVMSLLTAREYLE
jgi:hypothetical protein